VPDKLSHTPKYIVVLSMLYITAFMFPMMLAYRMVSLGPLLLPGGTLFFPASYLFGDIIAEVYGYQFARQLVWSAIFCQLLLGILITLVLHMPFPENWQNANEFNLVLGHSLRYAAASTLGNFFGEFINIYVVTKFKVLLKGKYFWLRSLGASCVGEAILTLTVFSITFVGLTPTKDLLKLTLSGYAFKMLFGLIALIPVSFFVAFLKRSENIDIYDFSTNFSPFKFSIENDAVILNKSE